MDLSVFSLNQDRLAVYLLCRTRLVSTGCVKPIMARKERKYSEVPISCEAHLPLAYTPFALESFRVAWIGYDFNEAYAQVIGVEPLRGEQILLFNPAP